MKICDVLIAGGGVPGLTLAAILGHAGLSVVLLDSEKPSAPLAGLLAAATPDGRTTALMGGSTDVLAQAGVWPALKPHGAPLIRMAVVDDSRFPGGEDAQVEQVFAAFELGSEAFGWNLPLATMRAALSDVLKKQKNVTHLTNTTLTDFTRSPTCMHVVTSGDERFHASLVVGCDGRNSTVRQKAGINVRRKAYGQDAITCLIRHTRPHDGTSVEFHRPGGPFTLVPMAGDMSAIVWVEKNEDADALLKLPRAVFTQHIQDRTRGRVGRVELASHPVSWPLEYLRAEKLVAPRVALAAETAHVISPIGAQGLNLSLRDISTLAAIIVDAHALGLDIGSDSVLARYATARIPDVASRSFAIDMANQAVANDTRAMRALRRLMLRAMSLPGPWRQLMMKKGMAAS